MNEKGQNLKTERAGKRTSCCQIAKQKGLKNKTGCFQSLIVEG